jgi:hypothetical protein
MSKTDWLTPQQQALIPEYQAKWGRIMRSHRPIDRSLATEGIQAAYREVGLTAPAIHFFDSPIAANRWIENCDQLGPFVAALDVSACMINFVTFVLKSHSPLGTPQSMADTAFSLVFENAIAIPKMEAVAKEISRPMFDHITQLANTQSIANPLAPIGNNFMGQLAQGMAQGVIFERQQAVRRSLLEQPWGNFFVQAGDQVWQSLRPIAQPIEAELGKVSTHLAAEFWKQLQSQPQLQALQRTFSGIWNNRGGFENTYSGMLDWLPAIDFSATELNQDFGIQQWSAVKKLTQECCWVYPFEKACIVIDRPTKCAVNQARQLHAEGEPALVFRDGHSVYAYQGLVLPEHYGRRSPAQWHSKWIIEEQNAELRRVLIEGIGYERLCQELKAKPLDSWREYTLLRIENPPIKFEVNDREVIEEPICLLKMVCPSTGNIHILRVPPDLETARAAIVWVNRDIDPEDFAIAT